MSAPGDSQQMAIMRCVVERSSGQMESSMHDTLFRQTRLRSHSGFSGRCCLGACVLHRVQDRRMTRYYRDEGLRLRSIVSHDRARPVPRRLPYAGGSGAFAQRFVQGQNQRSGRLQSQGQRRGDVQPVEALQPCRLRQIPA